MTARCISLRDWESRRLLALAAGETAVLVRPVDARVPYVWEDRRGMPWPYDTTWSHGDEGGPWMPCPLGRPGDELIGREAWAQVHPLQIREGRRSKPGTAGIPGPPGVTYRVIYKADGDYPRLYHRSGYPYRQLEPNGSPEDLCGDKWRPWWTGPQHMPARLARHRLTIVSVEVKRCVDLDRLDGARHMDVFETWDHKRFPWATSYAWVLRAAK